MLNWNRTVNAEHKLNISTGHYIIMKQKNNNMSKQNKTAVAEGIALRMMRNINTVMGINIHKSAGDRTRISSRSFHLLTAKILT